MKYLSIIIILVLGIGCKSQNDPIATPISINRAQFKEVLETPKEKIQIINFWATWCAPCVDELPAFEKLRENYKDQVDIILISLDDVEKTHTAVKDFVIKNEIKSSVMVLDDPYAAEWIPMVDKHWDGAIPVTLIKTNNKKQFYGKDFTYDELEKALKLFL